jgi:hypothetical protein
MNVFYRLRRHWLAPAHGARRSARPIVCRPRVRSLEDRTVPSVFAVVTTTADSGTGSLRDALTRLDASTSTSQLEIDYNIPKTDAGYNATTGLYTIKLASALPNITHAAYLDGTSQPGFAGTPLVVVAGSGTVLHGLVLDGTAGTYSSFSSRISSMALQGFDGYAMQVNDANSATAMQVTLKGNQIADTAGGDGILVFAGSNSTAVTLQQNKITLGGGGDGIVVHSGGNATNVTFANNRLTCVGGGDGIHVQENGKAADTLTFTGNRVTCRTGGDAVSLNGQDASNTIQFVNNTLNTSGGGDALYAAVSSTSLSSWTITNNAFHTNGQADGLNLVGGATLQALVQGNSFTNNKVGVRVTGNGTTAGTVDLGGGSLGSTGGNDFSTFTTATANSFAVGLFGVSASYTLHAQSNVWGVADPTTVIADGTHDTAAGGSGVILT